MNDLESPSASLSTYMNEIAQYPLLTADEEIELSRQLREGRDAARARERLIQSNLRLVVSIARRYRGQGLSLMDLIQEGNIGLQTGIEKYDWRKGYRLSTYVFWWIRQAVTRAIANSGRTIRLPVRAYELLHDARKAEQVLQDKLGRPPTPAEVASHLGVEPERLQAIRRAEPAPVSLDAPVADGSKLTRGDAVIDETALAGVLSAAEESDMEASVKAVIDRLPEHERQVVLLRYGLGSPNTRSLAEIGRLLGVSRERARQIEGNALRRLRGDVSLRRALAELVPA